jgi:hypothetical protein
MSDILNCIRVAGDAYLTDIRNKARTRMGITKSH